MNNKNQTNQLLLFIIPLFLMLAIAAIPQSQAKKISKSKTASHPASASSTVSNSSSYDTAVAPFVKKYCLSCHSGPKPPADVSLASYNSGVAGMFKSRKLWESVSRNVSDSHMPPASMPQPTQAERDRLVAMIEGTFTKADCQLNDPGHVTLRRLNREEYNNTIRDLMGVDSRPAEEFPNDDVGYGFDNIGDVLSISPLLMEKYVTAAERVTKAAILSPEDSVKPNRIEPAKLPTTSEGGLLGRSGRELATNGELTAEFAAPRDGDYLLKVNASGDQAGPEPAKMELRLDQKAFQVFDVTVQRRNPKNYEASVKMTKGKHRLGFAFINDYYNANEPDARKRDRNLQIYTIDIVPPKGLPDDLTASHKMLMIATPSSAVTEEQAARKIMSEFTRRAFRRPTVKNDVDRLVKYVKLAKDHGESFERGIQLAMQAVLISPNFLFRVETDPNPNNAKATRMLGDYELATRLAYFLWSSMPDEELFNLAAKKKLQDPTVLAAQARRMLKDPKAKALASNFAGQWLLLRNLNNVSPDTARYPEFNDTLRNSMRTETEMFFENVVHENRPITDFLDCNYTFLNEPLAKLYGIPGITGNDFRKVTLESNKRGGLLTQASILTVTSNPTRTSPVKRGKWVLEQILGTPPPPAPPDIPKLADDNKGPLVGTLRQRMEQHRKNSICASCHANMDPIGFGLENFDPIGKWREKDGDLPIDASGVLPGGKSFKGPGQLKTIMMSKKTLFARSLTEKMLTYALGRGLESYDKCNVTSLASQVIKNDYRFAALVTAVVQSDPFRKRRGDGGLK